MNKNRIKANLLKRRFMSRKSYNTISEYIAANNLDEISINRIKKALDYYALAFIKFENQYDKWDTARLESSVYETRLEIMFDKFDTNIYTPMMSKLNQIVNSITPGVQFVDIDDRVKEYDYRYNNSYGDDFFQNTPSSKARLIFGRIMAEI